MIPAGESTNEIDFNHQCVSFGMIRLNAAMKRVEISFPIHLRKSEFNINTPQLPLSLSLWFFPSFSVCLVPLFRAQFPLFYATVNMCERISVAIGAR